MKRVPIWFAVILEIGLIYMACEGMLTTQGLYVLIINAIFLLPVLFPVVFSILYIFFEKIKDIVCFIYTLAKVNTIKRNMRMLWNEKVCVTKKIQALVFLNNFFVVDTNRKYLRHLTDQSGNCLCEQDMQFIIVYYAQKISADTSLSDDSRNILEILIKTREEFATQKIQTADRWTKNFIRLLVVVILSGIIYGSYTILDEKINESATYKLEIHSTVENEDAICRYAGAQFAKTIAPEGNIWSNDILQPDSPYEYFLDVKFVVSDKDGKSGTTIDEFFSQVDLWIGGEKSETDYRIVYIPLKDTFVDINNSSKKLRERKTTDSLSGSKQFHILIPFDKEEAENSSAEIVVEVNSCFGNMEISVR